MQTPDEFLDELAIMSRSEKQSMEDYLSYLIELKEILEMRIETVKSDIKNTQPKRKGNYFGSEQEEIDREQEDMTNSQMQ